MVYKEATQTFFYSTLRLRKKFFFSSLTDHKFGSQKKPLNLFRMGFFGAAHGWGGWGGVGGWVKRPPSLKSVTHILQ